MKVDSTNDRLLNISVIVPISERHDDIGLLYRKHQKILARRQLSHEFIFVLDGQFPQAETTLRALQKENPEVVKIIRFNKSYGEARALAAAFNKATGEIILTLASYFQVHPEEIEKLFDNFTADVDVLFGNRYPRRDNLLNRLQSSVFHRLLNKLSGETFHDISCGVRLMRREVLEKVSLYGDLHRFIPLLAINKGYRVKEIPLEQDEQDVHLRIYGPGVYLRRLLDLMTLFFLLKFTQKPLRFFGLLGCGISAIGLIITLITVEQRLFAYKSLADRPLFLGGLLFILIGLQTFFIGLVAEIIIFMHMPDEPAYNVEEIVE